MYVATCNNDDWSDTYQTHPKRPPNVTLIKIPSLNVSIAVVILREGATVKVAAYELSCPLTMDTLLLRNDTLELLTLERLSNVVMYDAGKLHYK